MSLTTLLHFSADLSEEARSLLLELARTRQRPRHGYRNGELVWELAGQEQDPRPYSELANYGLLSLGTFGTGAMKEVPLTTAGWQLASYFRSEDARPPLH